MNTNINIDRNTCDSLKEKILKWCLPGFYIIGILGAVIYGLDYYNELKKEEARLLVLDKILEVESAGQLIALELNSKNKNEDVVFEVKDPSIVEVSEEGNLVGIKNGITTITVTNEENTKTQTFVVGVGKEAIDEIRSDLNKVAQLIEENKTLLPSYDILQGDTNKEEEFQNNNVTHVSLNKEKVTLNYNGTSKLTATVYPENAINKEVIWTSSDLNLVTVDVNGNIHAIGNKNGKAIITATTVDGSYKSSAEVTVKEVDASLKVLGITLNKEKVTLNYNGTTKLTATVYPENATNKNVTWTSSDSKLVSVDVNGNIHAIGNKNGKAIITATTVDGSYKVSTEVTVKEVETTVKVTGITLDQSSLTLNFNESAKLTATVYPENATNKNVTWTSSDSKLVSVDVNGNIKAVGNKNGKAVVAVTTKDGSHKATAEVTVKGVAASVKVTGITLDQPKVTLNYKESAKLTATVKPTNATNKNVTWTSSDSKLVSVDENGNIKAVGNKNGKAIITVTTIDGSHKTTATVTVKEVETTVKVTGITLDQPKVTLNYKESAKLTATVKPTNATNKNVTWTSSDSKLVSVDSKGNIKAVGNKNGKAIVTATTVDGSYKASAEVTVKEVDTTVKVLGVNLNKSKVTLGYIESDKLVATVYPANATNKNVTWTSSDSKLVSVDANGNIKAVGNKNGKATITVTTKDGSYKTSVVVTVVARVTGVSLNKTKATLNFNETAKLIATVKPTSVTNKEVTWTSNKPNLVTVDANGNIKAVGNKNGKATITVTTKDGSYKATATVTVKKVDTSVKVTGVSLNKTKVTLNNNEMTNLTATVYPENATNKNVTWTSSDSKLVSVDSSGNIEAIRNENGKATITVTTVDGSYKASTEVTVKEVDTSVKVTGVNLDQPKVTLNFNESAKLTAIVTPENATNKNVKWYSSDSKLVSVDIEGNIKAVRNKNGKVVVTAITVDGNHKATAEVTVKEVDTSVKVTGVNLDQPKVTLNFNESAKLTATVYPENATNKNVTWTSSDSKLVSVDGNGNIKAVGNKNGKAVVTVTTVDGSYKATAEVTVKKVDTSVKVTGVSLNKTKLTLDYKATAKLISTVTPTKATNKNVTWTSSNSKLVTVDANGNIKAVGNKNGKVVVTATTVDGSHKATAEVTVKEVDTTVKVTGIELNKTKLTLKYNESAKLTATVYPANATNKNVTWTTNNSNLVTVDANGNIKAVGNKDGKAIITATTKDGNHKASVTVTVKEVNTSVRVTGVTINQGVERTIYLNDTSLYPSGKNNVPNGDLTINLTATVYPENATNKEVTWTSSDENVATVDSDSGKVTVKNIGQTIITAKAGNRKAEYTLTVKQKVIIVITASAGQRMQTDFASYISKNGYYYYNSNAKYRISKVSGVGESICVDKNGKQTLNPGTGTLQYVFYSGTGYYYQIGHGTNCAIKNIKNFTEVNNNYEKYSEFHIFYTLTGNTANSYTCDDILDKGEHLKQLDGYKEGNESKLGYLDAIKKFKNISTEENAKNFKFYMLSHNPLNYSYGKETFGIEIMNDSKIVSSTNVNACNSGYRSAYKYWLSNLVMADLLTKQTYSEIKFIDGYSQIVRLPAELDVNSKNIKDASAVLLQQIANKTLKFEWQIHNKAVQYVENVDGSGKKENFKARTSYQVLYRTEDGLHWDHNTTRLYMPIVFNLADM